MNPGIQQKIDKRSGRIRWVVAALTGGIFLTMMLFPYATGYAFARQSIIGWLLQFWGLSDWQHGYLVFPIVAFLVWQRRGVLAQIEPRPVWLGGVISGVALLVYALGYRLNHYYFGYLAIHLYCWGAVLWFLGWRFLWVLFFPLLFIGFAWPLIFLESTLSFKLRLLMSMVSSGFLNLIGTETVRDGTAILSGAHDGYRQGDLFSVQVEGACAGLRSLFALMMVSALYGYYMLKKPWQRAALFLCAMPLAVLGNFARILLLVYGTIWWGSDFAIGVADAPGQEPSSMYHFGAGIAVFVVALGGMVLISTLMKKGFAALRRDRSVVRRGRGREAPEF